MKWWATSQVNSGGYYIENQVVKQIICVQANTEEEAIDKLDTITENFSEYCECCGDRWEYHYPVWLESAEFPDYMGRSLFDEPRDSYDKNKTYVLYLANGLVLHGNVGSKPKEWDDVYWED